MCVCVWVGVWVGVNAGGHRHGDDSTQQESFIEPVKQSSHVNGQQCECPSTHLMTCEPSGV